MSHLGPSTVVSVQNEKSTGLYESEAKEAGADATPVGLEEVVASTDGDDALKLAGTHAHRFDEQYYRRLRRKIVSRSA